MARTFEFYVERATKLFEAGFTSKAGQKDALSDVSRAYEMLRSQIQFMCLEIPHAERTQPQDDVYWGLPDLHNWKQKHAELVMQVFPQAVDILGQIEDMAKLRAAIKGAEIVKAERTTSARAEAIVKSIRQIMDERKAQYARGLKVWDMFNGLPVSVNVHLVVNQHGTEFLRAFYFMAGVMTPLNVILAVMDAKAEKTDK